MSEVKFNVFKGLGLGSLVVERIFVDDKITFAPGAFNHQLIAGIY